MKNGMIVLYVLCVAMCGLLFTVSRTAAQSSYAAYADAAAGATCCELTSCGCLGMRCSCGECGK